MDFEVFFFALYKVQIAFERLFRHYVHFDPHVTAILGPFLESSWVILGSLCDQLGIVQVSFWGRFAVGLASFWGIVVCF